MSASYRDGQKGFKVITSDDEEPTVVNFCEIIPLTNDVAIASLVCPTVTDGQKPYSGDAAGIVSLVLPQVPIPIYGTSIELSAGKALLKLM